jgi:hypothetical protein
MYMTDFEGYESGEYDSTMTALPGDIRHVTVSLDGGDPEHTMSWGFEVKGEEYYSLRNLIQLVVNQSIDGYHYDEV